MFPGMRAVQFSRFGVPEEVAEVVDLPDPQPGPGEVVVELLASPINPADLLYLRGEYGVVPPLPADAGFEGVARVVALGSDAVTHVQVGDRVLLNGGAWRERAVRPASEVFPLPRELPDDQLAMLTVNPLTARAMLSEVRLPAGAFVIKNAANSGVGSVFFALARRAGLRGVAVVRRPGLEDMLKKFGAEHVLVDGPDLAERVRALVGDGSLPLAVDAVGGAATARLGACVSPGGTVLNYGLLSGEACHLSAADLVFRGVVLRGFWLANWFRRTSLHDMQAAYGELLTLIGEGVVHTPVEASYPLHRVREALQHAARGGRDGKVLLRGG